MPRRRLAAVLLLAAVGGAAHAQPVADADSLVLRRLRDESAARSQVVRTATILSDVFGPRLAGSPAYRAAAEWTRRELASYGLASARLEPWGTRRGRAWAVTRHSIELTAPYYARLVAYPKAWSPATNGVVRGAPMLVTDVRGDSDVVRYGDRLRGKIVLLGAPRADTGRFAPLARRLDARQLDSLAGVTEPGEPKDYWEDAGGYAENVRRRQRLFTALARAGVAATLEASRNANAVLVSGYQAYDSDVSRDVPGFVVSRADYARVVNLVRLADSVGRPAPVLAVELATTSVAPRTREDSTGYNVIAELPGSDPSLGAEVVMAGGHFDAWPAGTGATDNAAGVAVAMEAVRLLRAVGARPKRTIRVAFWDGEEHEDYYGSLGWAIRHLGDPETMRLRPGHDSVAVYFNLDHGTGRVRGLALQGNVAARPLAERVLAPVADLGAATVSIANKGSSDHMPFVALGLPAFNFLQDPLHYDPLTHHTNEDVAANLFPDDLRQAALVMAWTLYATASLPERIPRPPLPAPRPAAGR